MKTTGLQHVSENSLKNTLQRRLHGLLHGRISYLWLQHCESECSKLLGLRDYTNWLVAGRGGLVVGRPTAVREDPGSNLTAAGCVYHDNHCDIQPWARVVHPYCSALVDSAFHPPWDGKMSISL